MIDDRTYALIYRTTRKNAATRGLLFDLSRDDFAELVARADSKCEVSGLPFSLERAGSFRRPFAPSIDRVNNQLGYQLSNVRLVCVITNFALSDWGIAPLLRLARALDHREATQAERRHEGLRQQIETLQAEAEALRCEVAALHNQAGRHVLKNRSQGTGTFSLRKDGRWESKCWRDGKRVSIYARTEAELLLKLKEL
ncbi:hypothetical protein [Deinococcus hopiensis]|uniref:Uncharacterized protein n=1 Tax=Deinococcus hopiensis KR-140 TaxID=695939 RepID=A0A1W1VKD0_9DEIO|nr:hypothetical protein [Deinococcus hopiensis]SMB93404.1 hypothetical protein SAMN00790413_01968 [Deinococcus hopiensis KR-140]